VTPSVPPAGTMPTGHVLDAVAAWRPDLGIVFGSGLAMLPGGAAVVRELEYAELGWPCTAVAGHANKLILARAAAVDRELKLALACGRPHRYEGWRDEDLERPLRDLAAAGVRRFMLVNACGGLGAVCAGQTVVCSAVIDLQRPPHGPRPERLPVCTKAQAAQTVSILSARLNCLPGASESVAGVYVALGGPQFETPAEARWLARYGDVVGMSAAPEVRAAAACAAQCMLIGVVANAAGGADTHAAVLQAASDRSRRLAAALIPTAAARWPELAGPEEA